MIARSATCVGALLLVATSHCACAESFLAADVSIQEHGASVARSDSYVDIVFELGEYPNVSWTNDAGNWGWAASGGLLVEAENLGDTTIVLHLRIDNPGADGKNACNRATLELPPHARRELRTRINTNKSAGLWGMRGVPDQLPTADGPPLDPEHITAFQLFLNHPASATQVRLHRLELLPSQPAMQFPFVDQYGQYMHADWPGKVDSDDELRERAATEALPGTGLVSPEDRYGGWADGPRLETTGWFRTTQHGGRWWLVTPEGTLFFSLGVDCVGSRELTFVEDRKNWFQWLPDASAPLFGPIFGHARDAHPLSGAVGGEGRTFSFYCANLARKYGASWLENSRLRAFQRLRAWNFNTLGNWAEAEVIRESPLPYVASCALHGLAEIKASEGHWAKMHDVFAPDFAEGVDAQVKAMVLAHRDRPLCLGYFVDNELAWEGVLDGVLRSNSAQPTRTAFHRFLRARYPDIATLNTAWGTHLASLEEIAPGLPANETRERDLDAYLYEFACVYFRTVATAIHTHDPNHMYLGCRFASAPPPVVRAAGEFADVVSFNIYRDTVDCVPLATIGKPVIIGEFHFGATDRGLFHPGISTTRTQAERAAAYTAYIESAASCPAVVGAHWFQFVDEPLTGRWYDGENYNIGLVDVTDTPYPELVNAATLVNARIYDHRAAQKPQ